MTSNCRHCGRRITNDDGLGWIDPEATGDDSIWRETCDSNDDTFEANHEPELDEEEDSLTDESSDSFICHTDEDGDHVEHPTGYGVLILTEQRPFVYGPYPTRVEAQLEANEHELNHPEWADGSEGTVQVTPMYDGWAQPVTSVRENR